MKRLVRAAAAALALTASASVAEAQGPISFGLAGGISIPSGEANNVGDVSLDYGDIYDTGYHITLVMGFKAPMVPFGLRGEVMYTKFNGNDQISNGVPEEGPGISIFSVHVNGLFELPLPIAKPYLIGGLGIYSSKQEDTGSSNQPQVDRQNDFGLNFGIGTKFQLTGLSTFVEVRYHLVFNSQDQDPDQGLDARENFKFIPITFGIMF